jgi:hypothetical protein
MTSRFVREVISGMLPSVLLDTEQWVAHRPLHFRLGNYPSSAESLEALLGSKVASVQCLGTYQTASMYYQHGISEGYNYLSETCSYSRDGSQRG